MSGLSYEAVFFVLIVFLCDTVPQISKSDGEQYKVQYFIVYVCVAE